MKTHRPPTSFVSHATLVFILTITLLVFASSGVVYAAGGVLDTTFGVGGLSLVNSSGSTPSTNDLDDAKAIAVQADGKIVAAGATILPGTVSTWNLDGKLMRYNADGSLDQTFGNGGVAKLGFATSPDEFRDLAIQSDGKIVAAGYSSGALFVTRVNEDGSLDASFGAGGFATVSGPAASSVAIQSDGKIVLLGESSSKFFVARLLPADGALDAAFGSGGTVLVAPRTLSVAASDMTLQVVSGEERIVLAGMLRKGWGDGDFGLMRLRPNGAVDTTFGSAGAAQTDLGGSDRIFGVTVDASNRIVAVGTAGGARSTTGDDFGIARYTASGQLDTTFGSGGKQRTDFAGMDERAQSVTVQADGKVVVCGSANNGLTYDVGLARYTANGVLDVTFGYGGRVQVDLFGNSDHGKAVVTQTVTNPDSTTRERLLVGGTTNTGNGYDTLVVAYEE